MAVLCVRHHFVRLWGLANRVVVLDEVHAYDTYTSGLIEALLRWLKGLGCSVVLMSATLPERRRTALLAAWGAKDLPGVPYPRVLMASGGQTQGATFEVRPQAPIAIHGMAEELDGLAQAALQAVCEGGCAAVIVNTVTRAQALYLALKGHAIPEVELQLFHARFPADDRQEREQRVLATFGKGVANERPSRAILVATQVAEQSLDVDFDVMFTDLAPMDLLLQRAGRLHRHERPRPARHGSPVLHIAGLMPDRAPELKKTAWGFVYDPYVLLATWKVALRDPLWRLPADIDRLVQEVYSGDPFENEDREALLESLDAAFGEHLAKEQDMRRRAHNAALDATLEPSQAFLKTPLGEDDEASGLLLASTRLGEESCTVIPVFDSEEGWRVSPLEPPFDPEATLPDALAKQLYARQVRIGRKGLVQALLATPPPRGFDTHPLLRHLRPLRLTDDTAQVEGHTLRLDPELGITYARKEDA